MNNQEVARNIGRYKLLFEVQSGSVLSSDKREETRVWSEGGGGYVGGYAGPHGGHVGGWVQPPRVKSESITKHEFWLRTDNGREVAVKLSGHDIPLREGQHISLISARNLANNTNDAHVALVNHSAQQYWHLQGSRELANSLNLLHGFYGALGIGIFALIVAAIMVFAPIEIAYHYSSDAAPALKYDGKLIYYTDERYPVLSFFGARTVFSCNESGIRMIRDALDRRGWWNDQQKNAAFQEMKAKMCDKKVLRFSDAGAERLWSKILSYKREMDRNFFHLPFAAFLLTSVTLVSWFFISFRDRKVMRALSKDVHAVIEQCFASGRK